MANTSKTETCKCRSLLERIRELKEDAIRFTNEIKKGKNKILGYAQCAYTMLCLPATIMESAADVVDSYKRMVEDTKNQVKGMFFGKNNILNVYANARLHLTASVAGLANSLLTIADVTSNSSKKSSSSSSKGSSSSSSGGSKTSTKESVEESENTGFQSREDVINAVVAVEEVFDSYVAFVDEMNSLVESSSEIPEEEKSAIFTDSSETVFELQKFITKVEAKVLKTAFSLATRKTIKLGSDRQILELLTELYGNINRYDEFVRDNNLNADEIEIIPMGREVSYYVS